MTNQTVAAARPRVLSPSPISADWCTRPALTDTRNQSAVGSLSTYHNSITSNAPTAGGVGFGATKQASPPRGVPR